jgi:CDP-diacylglycerol---glycerol-3-phosphate 3-phosphatidyltransferase
MILRGTKATLTIEQRKMRRLRLDWAVLSITGWALIGAGFVVLVWFTALEPALAWLAVTGGMASYHFAYLWRYLHENRLSSDAPLLPTLGLANAITISRSVWVAALFGFFLIPKPGGLLAWAPGALYAAVALADYLDGYVARITGRTTLLGERLDMHWDGAGLLAGASLAVLYGQAPLPYLLVGLARYLYVFGLWVHKKRGQTVYELPPNRFRRATAGMQMGFVAVILLPVFQPPATQIAAVLFMLPHIISFTSDWLTVTGWRRDDPLLPAAAKTWLRQWPAIVLPLAARGLLVVLLIGALNLQARLSAPAPEVVLVAAFAIPFLLFGAAGRVTALLVLLMSGFAVQRFPLELLYWLIIPVSAILFIAGTGRFSLWTPEDWLILHRAGERTHPNV